MVLLITTNSGWSSTVRLFQRRESDEDQVMQLIAIRTWRSHFTRTHDARVSSEFRGLDIHCQIILEIRSAKNR